MPEMPGMPYMEHEGEGKFENGIYSFVINFCMDGTWQYNISDLKQLMIKFTL